MELCPSRLPQERNIGWKTPRARPAPVMLLSLPTLRSLTCEMTGVGEQQLRAQLKTSHGPLPRGKYTDLSRQTVSKRGLKRQETEET